MSYLLDTNVFVSLINGRAPSLRLRYQSEVDRHRPIYLSSIVQYELLYGVSKSVQKEKNRIRLAEAFGPEVTLLPFEAADAAEAARIRATLEARKQPIGHYDTLVAGQALARNLTLVTANTREFARIEGLKWQDWTSTP